MATDFTIFNFEPNECYYGFALESQESKIAVTVEVGILFIFFAISSVMVLLRNSSAGFLTLIGFALVIASALMIIASLSCRLPLEFLSNVMILRVIDAVATISIIYFIRKKNYHFLKKNDPSILEN